MKKIRIRKKELVNTVILLEADVKYLRGLLDEKTTELDKKNKSLDESKLIHDGLKTLIDNALNLINYLK